MNYTETLSWIHGTERFGSRLGLGRMGRLLHRMGDPHLKVPFIHVAGTNGKGSTTTLIASALTAGGFKTGKFISPYILEFRERMQIDGQMIPEETLAALATRLRPIAEEFKAAGDPVTEFELVTVLGLCWFAEQNCDIAVLEVGLGGRLDATNIIPPPVVAVITRIDYDHTAILGDTLSAIAGEKCGIVKRGSTVISYPDQAGEALAVIRRRTEEENDPLLLPDLSQLTVLSSGLCGSRFCYRGEKYSIPLPGPHQVLNAVTALEALKALSNTRFAVSPQEIAAGFAAARFPARLELLRQSPPVLLDGAHNPNGGRALCDAVKSLGLHDLTAVVGMLRDKDCLPVLQMMAPYCAQMIVTTVPNPRSYPAEEFAGLARSVCPRVTVCPDCQEAARLALAEGGNGVLVFGSLYLASAVRPVMLAETEKNNAAPTV